MKLSALVVLPVSLALGLATTQVAEARVADPPTGMRSQIERAVDAHSDGYRAEASNQLRTRGDEVSSQSGSGMTLELPGSSGRKHREGALTLHTTGGRAFRTAVQDTGDGSFRALLYLTSASASRRYRFELKHGLTASPHADGGLVVRDRFGSVVGRFARPWARDARGQAVRTRYIAHGSVITQVIQLTPATSFPVVADPWWIPVLVLGRILLGVITKHAARQAAARGISHALIRQVIKNGARSRGNNNTTVYTQGKGSKRIRVIVDNRSGNVITVTKG